MTDSRTAAAVLNQIAAYLELAGENRFKIKAYQQAARALLALNADDLGALAKRDLHATPGLGPATLAVVHDLIQLGESRYLEELRAATPEGLLEMLRVPGLGPQKIFRIHAGLGIQSVQELEDAAKDGRLAKLPRFGARTAEKVLKSIAFMRETGALVLYPHALAESRPLLALVLQHPDVVRAEVAGSIRRHNEVVQDVDIAAGCSADPAQVAASFTNAPGVKRVTGAGGASVCIHYVDGARLDLHCVVDDELAVALWRATGSASHVEQVTARLAGRGLRLTGDRLVDAKRKRVKVASEEALYRAAGLAFVPPEMREGRGEVEAAARDALPTLVTLADVRGVLHCHSQYSDGKATIAQMASAAADRGWSYLGISDHSEAAFYAGGVSRSALLAQHEEIDALNESQDRVRVLKGIEADILADGRIDYDARVLARFDYVIGSVHSRFAMDGDAMTERVLRAMDDPMLTILGHPTGRLLLNREPYAIDMDAVLQKAAAKGVAVELNADPHRLDIDWRLLQRARELGVRIEIGPDAHSTAGLDYMEIGIGMARKGWLEPGDILNCGSVDSVLAFASARH
ncbi:MAG: hypothetical protein JWO05_2446 [Gemmatimonadetes bacterium]|nr:hypothetical protein [Gemmatimonadota bacterium]